MKKFIISTIAALALIVVLPAAPAHATVCQPTSFTADEYELDAGEGTVFHWDSIGCDSGHASIAPADNPNAFRPPYGSVSSGAIMYSTVFTLTVYDKDGNIGGQRFLTIHVNDDNNDDDDDNDNDSNCRIDEFEADGDDRADIEEGDSVELSWRTTGCDRAKILPDLGTVNLDDSEDVDPDEDTTYTLYVYDEDGDLQDTETVRVYVDEDSESCSIDEFSADDYSLERGESARITWRTSGADDVDINPDYDNRSDDGSVTVHPTRTTTYTLEVNCSKGSDKTRSLTIRVNDTGSAPQAITTVASILSGSSAQLNGIAVPNTSSGTTHAWFEWGPSTSLGYKTAAKTIPSNSSENYYNAPVSGLIPGTIYYYRAVVENQNGIAYGGIVKFQTQQIAISTTPTTIVKTQVVHDTVVAKSAASLLELRVDSAYDRMCVGGQIDYTITYRNISSQTLRDTVLEINHQKEVTLISSSRGDYDVVDRTVTIDLGDISPGETGTILFHGRINDAATRDNLTVITAQVVYTNSLTKAQESAIAYSLVTISDDCPNILGASAFGFGHFLPDTLLEWLLLILVILALVVLARQLKKKPAGQPPMA